MASTAAQVTLQCDERAVSAPPWPTLAWEQVEAVKGLTIESFAEHAGQHQPYAFYDRDSFATDEWRRVYCVRGLDCVHVFDESGNASEDTSHPAGRHPLVVEKWDDPAHTASFLPEWKEGYYKLPETEGRGPRTQPPTPVPSPSPFEKIAGVGNRIKVAMEEEQGTAVKWFGGVIFAEETIKEVERFRVAWDDGTMTAPKKTDLEELFRNDMLDAATEEEGGIIKNVTGYAMADDVTYLHGKPVGVLVGKGDTLLANVPIHESYFVNKECFKDAEPSRKSRSATPDAAPMNEQDRYGFHTFRRGDVVEYIFKSDTTEFGLKDGQSAHACVYGLNVHDKNSGKQGHKFLILYEEESEIFFVGCAARWRRMPAAESSSTFDVDDDDAVKRMGSEALTKMLHNFTTTEVFMPMTTETKVKGHAVKDPPSLKLEKEAAKKAGKAAAAAKATAKAAAVKKAAAAAKAAEKARKAAEKAAQAAAAEKAADEESARNRAGRKGSRVRKEAQEAPAADESEAAGGGDADGNGKSPRQTRSSPRSQNSPPMAPPKQTSSLPPGWKMSTDPEGAVYYYNWQLNQTQYEHPGASSPPMPPPPRTASHGRSSSSSASANYGSSSCDDDFQAQQRKRQIVELTAKLPFVSGDRLAEVKATLAGLEFDEYQSKKHRKF